MHPHPPLRGGRPAPPGQGGFTLIELLMVIAVLGVLSGVVVFAVGSLTDRAEESACAADERVLVTALETHAATSGSYVDEDALVAEGQLRSASASHDVVLAGDGYTVVATGDCAGGTADVAAAGAGEPATTTTLAPTTTAPIPTASISSITGATAVNLSTNKWRATATVRVTDDLGQPVDGAGVVLTVQQQSRTGTWKALPDASGTTDGSGVAVVSSVDVNKYPVPRIRFAVSSVGAAGLTWQQDDTWAEVAKP